MVLVIKYGGYVRIRVSVLLRLSVLIVVGKKFLNLLVFSGILLERCFLFKSGDYGCDW